MIIDTGRPTVEVDVLLPCLDEAGALPWVLSRIPAGYRAIVVDNGSRDGSAELAAALGALVVHEAQRGYGAAVHRGLLTATADLIAVIDCDGSLDPAELPAMIALIQDGHADLVCARRVPVEPGVWPWHARLGTVVLASILSIGSRVRLHDIAPVRVATRTTLVALDLQDRRCGYPLETVLRAREQGARVVEVPVAYRRRALGTRSKISGTVRGTRIAATDFIAVAIRLRGGTRRPAATSSGVASIRPSAGVGR